MQRRFAQTWLKRRRRRDEREAGRGVQGERCEMWFKLIAPLILGTLEVRGILALTAAPVFAQVPALNVHVPLTCCSDCPASPSPVAGPSPPRFVVSRSKRVTMSRVRRDVVSRSKRVMMSAVRRVVVSRSDAL